MEGRAIRADVTSLTEPASAAVNRPRRITPAMMSHRRSGVVGAGWYELDRPPVEDGTWAALLEQLRFHRASRLLYHMLLKRWIDVLVATLALIALSPLLLVVAIVIRLDSPGAIIFRQTRVGRYGRLFVIYKFRTMLPDRRRQNLPVVGPERRCRHKSSHDPRITQVGRFLRASSIDELPQLFNVLRGEMSLVGPRPELPEIVRNYAPWQHQRHLVLPGLTGWWQVEGRGDRLMHENTELDLYYVDNQSLRLDIWIIMRTFGALVARTGAF